MKAQSELNWVFILVAGAIILGFFTGFAFKYKSLQEEKLSIELLTKLDNSLTSLQSSPYNTITEINLPKDIEVRCNEIKIDKEKFKTNNLIFSQNKLRNKMLIYYKPFKAPFKIADFYFIIDGTKNNVYPKDQNSRIYLENLKENLPEKFKENFNIVDTKGREVQINQDFFIINNKQYPLHEDLVYASLLSDDFECFYEKIKEKTNNAVIVYQNKVNILNQGNCNYGPFISYLNQLKTLDFNAISSIESLNQNLVGKNCPALY